MRMFTLIAAALFAAASPARADVFYFDRATGKVTQLPDSAAPATKNAHQRSACSCEVCECKNCECLDAPDSADNDVSQPSLEDPADASPRSRADVSKPKPEAKAKRVRYDVCNGKSCTTFEVNEGDAIPANARNVRFAPSSAAPADASPLSFDASEAVAQDRGERRGLFARIRANIEARRAARAERGGIFGRARGGSCASCGQ